MPTCTFWVRDSMCKRVQSMSCVVLYIHRQANGVNIVRIYNTQAYDKGRNFKHTRRSVRRLTITRQNLDNNIQQEQTRIAYNNNNNDNNKYFLYSAIL